MEDSTSNPSGARSPRTAPAKKAASKAPGKQTATKPPAKNGKHTATEPPVKSVKNTATKPPAKNAKKAATATATRAPRVPRTRAILPAEEPLLPQLESLLSDAAEALPAEKAVEKEKVELPRGHIPLWAHLVADPGYAAEHAAREIVRRLGPQAIQWLLRTTARYPGASPDAVARLAAAEASRSGWRRAAGSATAGGLGSLATTGFLAHSRARLVLTIAGAYGLDPTHDDRAADLLTLLRVPRLTQPTMAAVRNTARIAAGIVTRAVAARLVPFGATLAGAVQATTGVDDVAMRAQAYYRDYKNGSRSFNRV